jgi:hypothetical protein
MELNSSAPCEVLMGVREKLAERKGLTVAFGTVLLAVGVAAAFYQFRDMSPGIPKMPTVYYTIDEGKNLFTGSADLLPPFDHDGKPAVRAYVFKCSGKQFVGYLERLTPEARQMARELDEAVKNARPGDKPPANLQQLANARRFGREVKRPGEGKWVPIGSSEGAKVVEVQPPAGASGPVERVDP